jgi:hypothetical protein
VQIRAPPFLLPFPGSRKERVFGCKMPRTDEGWGSNCMRPAARCHRTCSRTTSSMPPSCLSVNICAARSNWSRCVGWIGSSGVTKFRTLMRIFTSGDPPEGAYVWVQPFRTGCLMNCRTSMPLPKREGRLERREPLLVQKARQHLRPNVLCLAAPLVAASPSGLFAGNRSCPFSFFGRRSTVERDP